MEQCGSFECFLIVSRKQWSSVAHKDKLYQALTTETILVHMIDSLLVLLLFFLMGFADSEEYCPTYPINQFTATPQLYVQFIWIQLQHVKIMSALNKTHIQPQVNLL